MKAKPIELSESERGQLQTLIKKGSDWQEGSSANDFDAVHWSNSPCGCRAPGIEAGSDSGAAAEVVEKGDEQLAGSTAQWGAEPAD